jgi:hypothetical protein
VSPVSTKIPYACLYPAAFILGVPTGQTQEANVKSDSGDYPRIS